MNTATPKPLAVAAIGDSLTTNFHLSSFIGTLTGVFATPDGNWFADTSERIPAVSARLGGSYCVTARNHASVSARVDLDGRRSMTERALRTRNFSHQIREVLGGPRFPDLLLVWIGHNNLDWTSGRTAAEIMAPANIFDTIAHEFTMAFEVGLTALLRRAIKCHYAITIVVFGLINFEHFFRARVAAENARARDPRLYPYAERCYSVFDAMRPSYRHGVIELAQHLNADLEDVITRCHDSVVTAGGNIGLCYSDNLYRTDIGVIDALSQWDAWHPSTYAHRLLADSAHEAVQKALGMQTGRSASHGKY